MFVHRQIRIALVAGEVSGDFLGAGLIAALKKQLKNVEFYGIGGSKMIAEGFRTMVPMERLSVMGISDVLWRYPELYQIRRRLISELLANPPDLFIGIDYQHFNLYVETQLKQNGVKTIQYVSPKIWAWRQKRVFKVKKAVDLMLTIFPFEDVFYRHYSVPVRFVGHPLADVIPLENNVALSKKALGIKPNEIVIAILPGSRLSELRHMAAIFIDIINKINVHRPEIRFIFPMVSGELKAFFEHHYSINVSKANVKVMIGQAREVMAAADLVLVKSGTATLEAMLLKRPMVVLFKWGVLSHAIIAPQLKIPFVSLPNLLANQALVPEFIQGKICLDDVVKTVFELLDDVILKKKLQIKFGEIHHQLRQNANEKAASAVLELLG